MTSKKNDTWLHTRVCLTHSCNLNCVYCFQKHRDSATMTLEVAKSVIDRIFDNIPDGICGVEIGFFGGEPLLKFDLIKEIFAYTCSKKRKVKYVLFATTNGTLLTEEMKNWFAVHKKRFKLLLSLDGTRETHNYNRSGSFEKIDLEFFLKNWPSKKVKMTLSEYSLPRLAEDIKFIHSRGFKNVSGVNLALGTFDWSDDNYLKLLAPQFKELVKFYLDNDELKNQMLDRDIALCEVKEQKKRKWCSAGDNYIFFDIDGKKYPCSFFSPMTFSEEELSNIMEFDFTNIDNVVDEYCLKNCYIYSICPSCIAENYLNNKTLNIRDKSRCKIQKLLALFIADLQAKRIEKNPKIYDANTLYHTVEAIKKIRYLYLSEFENYLL